MTNDDMATVIDTSDEWIRTRSGIQERRVSHVPCSDLAAVAGSRALAAAGVDVAEVDLLIVATCTPDTIIPSTAAHVQRKMGARNSAVFDLNAGCSGFVYSMTVANSLVRSGVYRKVLVIGAERITWLLNWSLRDTAVLFGDGAVMPYRVIFTMAVVVGAAVPLQLVWNIADITNLLMALPNLLSLILLAGLVRKLQKKYFISHRAGN